MTRRLALFVVLALALALNVAAPVPPAAAGPLCDRAGICGDLYHADDAGIDDPIPVSCDWGWDRPWRSVQRVPERRAATCHDVDGLRVPRGRVVACLRWWPAAGLPGAFRRYEVVYSGLGTRLDRTGRRTRWHKIRDTANETCVVRAA